MIMLFMRYRWVMLYTDMIIGPRATPETKAATTKAAAAPASAAVQESHSDEAERVQGGVINWGILRDVLFFVLVNL